MDLTYNEAEELVRSHLKQIKNLAEYSRQLKSSYQVLSIIRNNNSKGRVYYKVVFNVLTDMGLKPKVTIIKQVNYTINKK